MDNTKEKTWIQTWGRTIWWAVLSITLLIYSFLNSGRILSKDILPVDSLIILVLFLLLLLPLASEVTLFGISIKKEIESLKTEFRDQILILRSEIHQTNVQNTNITFPQPLSDDELKMKEQEYSTILKIPLAYEIKEGSGKKSVVDPLDDLQIPKKNKNLSTVRILLESELRRIYVKRFGEPRRKPILFERHLVQSLMYEGKVNDDIVSLIDEIRIICNNAIHGGEVTDEQYEFVVKFFPKIIDTLKRL